GRDLMPAEAKALSDDINRALVADDGAKAELLTRALHERAIQRIKETIDAAGADEKMRRRLVVQVRTPRAFEDVDSLLRILVLRDVVGDLAHRLPKHLRTFEREQIDQVKALVEAAAAQKSPDLAARKTDIFVCGLVLVNGWRSPRDPSPPPT